LTFFQLFRLLFFFADFFLKTAGSFDPAVLS